MGGANKGLGEAPKSCTRKEHESATNPIAKRGQGGTSSLFVCPLQVFNEDEFWTYVPLPAIWKQSPAFADNVYWRGRVWPPLNYMTYNGLKRYGLDKEASRLAARCMEIFSSRWKEERASFENYNSLTGQGSDSVDTDFFLGWGGLFPLM